MVLIKTMRDVNFLVKRRLENIGLVQATVKPLNINDLMVTNLFT